MNPKYQHFASYIKEEGGSPTTEQFDEDWFPVGGMIRHDMKVNKITTEVDGKVMLYKEPLQ